VSGLVVLDIDARHRGTERLARIKAVHAPLPGAAVAAVVERVPWLHGRHGEA
jgi:hypothetical protein